MKPLHGWAVALVAAVLVVGAVGWSRHAGSASAAATAASAPADEPVVQIRSELPTRRVLDQTFDQFGDVSAGQLAGLSFARAGQVTRLSVLAGDRVAKGAVLAVLSVDPAGREAYLQATNAFAVARREADRLRQLLGLQLATRSQVDAADKAVRDATGAVQALDALGGGAPSSTIAAPFDGVVASVAVAQGDRVAAGAAILQLARSDALRVQIGVQPADSPRVHPGTKATLTPIASGSSAPTPIEVDIATVQDMVDPKTQLVNAIAIVPNAGLGRALVPGMKVRARLVVGSVAAIAVPRNAVLADGQGDYVFQVLDGRAHRVAVTKLLESGGYVGINGLTRLDLPVVTLGNYELQDGMPVKEAAT